MHHDRLNKATAAIADWNARIFKLRDDIAKAEAALADSTRVRQQHVLDAALGDDGAKQRLEGVLEADRKAERQLDDLKIALPAAMERLRAAENDRRVAESEFRKAEVNRLARKRVAAAAAIDQAFADFSKAWSEYEALGKELFNAAADDHAANIHSFTESVDGMLRLAAALPHQPFYDLRWRHSFAPIGTSSSLAAAESSYWRLPPIEETKAA
jgi:hypothetical protein